MGLEYAGHMAAALQVDVRTFTRTSCVVWAQESVRPVLARTADCVAPRSLDALPNGLVNFLALALVEQLRLPLRRDDAGCIFISSSRSSAPVCLSHSRISRAPASSSSTSSCPIGSSSASRRPICSRPQRFESPLSVLYRLATTTFRSIMTSNSEIEVLMTDAPPVMTRRRSAWSRCDEAVARVAPTATTTCQVCNNAIAQGDWQIGLMFIHVEGFMLMEWYHLGCSAHVPGLPLDDLVKTVQSEMAPEQKQSFHAALVKSLAETPLRPSVSQ